MRHKRGHRWVNNPTITNFNRRNSLRITVPFDDLRTNNQPTKINTHLTYVGRCRCGFGPNAYYQTSNGRILHYNQITKPPQKNSLPQPNDSPPKIIALTPPQVETYRICSQCGSQVRDDAFYCTECGNELMNSLNFPYLTKKEQIEILKEKIRDLKGQIKTIKKEKF